MHLDAVENLARDPRRFPHMSRTLPAAMQEETLRVLEDDLFDSRGDYRALFGARPTFVNRELAGLYNLSDPGDERFRRVRTPVSEQRFGLLGHASFLAANAGEVETSPTARGKFVREVLLCEDVPAPPPDADTSLPEPPAGAVLTLRERLEDHRADIGCGRCHRLIDPLGLAFERFDAIGRYRDEEAGAPIDTSAELDGRELPDLPAFAAALAADARVPACFVRQMFRFATGRLEQPADEPGLRALARRFAHAGHRTHEAVLALVESDLFLTIRGGAPR
jgi:hypothetical protein